MKIIFRLDGIKSISSLISNPKFLEGKKSLCLDFFRKNWANDRMHFFVICAITVLFQKEGDIWIEIKWVLNERDKERGREKEVEIERERERGRQREVEIERESAREKERDRKSEIERAREKERERGGRGRLRKKDMHRQKYMNRQKV